MEHIDISVIVNTWNREAFLVDALDSLMTQDYGGKTQVIVCDDGSTDGTPEVISQYADKFDKFDVLEGDPRPEDRFETSRLAIMINRALKLCTGRYISYLPDDDVYRPERNRVMTAFLDKNLDVYLVYHWMKLILISSDKAVVGQATDLCEVWDEPNKFWIEQIFNRIDHTSFVHRNLGGRNVRWDEDIKFKRMPDWGFLLAALRRGLQFAHIPMCLAIGRKIQGESLNVDGDQMIAEKLRKERGAKA